MLSGRPILASVETSATTNIAKQIADYMLSLIILKL